MNELKETQLLNNLRIAVEGKISSETSCPLHRKTPFIIGNITQTQFSVARRFGTCTFNGDHYTYFASSDELWRDDFLKWAKQQFKELKKK